jgi:peptidoglycan-N-acetylglucosamine deacetylase
MHKRITRSLSPLVSITIDAEFPDRGAADPLGVCDRLLRILADREVTATFFVVGEWARAQPERIAAIAEAGHHIGNHGYSHRRLTKLTDADIVADITRCGEELARAGLETRPWFRAPYGDTGIRGARVQAAISRAGYQHIGWHAHGLDWKPGRKPEAIVSETLRQVNRRWPDPAIILLHSWPDPTAEALEQLLDRLEEWGAEFVTVPALVPFMDLTSRSTTRAGPRARSSAP